MHCCQYVSSDGGKARKKWFAKNHYVLNDVYMV